ncbi:glycosyltransferase family 2 protein [Lutimaribacter sp. EGI FJ00015]|uniref:Glycosyltransferase family 2 protein n=1 Tax=Lutimaribacter degradans TaxID=2945989 RepID=A0ACC5ZT60_9RHOB|nr:glycosyltransferase family 2 protein [Lutimaribacter sp. EGI FJ00013]MCM2560961.1 glycosyltransferase family 2 protein [Lutimaribacter sp. EGI FJ00013]MCO0612093.1 glycosyltransferase family 2 protein [Lutimaribacter sp. EGI FJ00015]MCO0634787.1 glycosyltransferase family 2 protein [Lutimaribacter sp. EGI FJ00014]
MRIYLHIGLAAMGAARLQDVLADKREQLLQKGYLFPRAAGGKNHTRLFMAVTDPDHIDTLRFNRGYITPEKQAALYNELAASLARDVETHKPRALILSASQLGPSLARDSELARLRAMLAPLSDDIRIIAHVDEQGRALSRHYTQQVMEGRGASLDLELEMAGTRDWWDDALLDGHVIEPDKGQFLEVQCPAFWLDYQRLVTHWEGVFGPGSVTLRPYDEARFYGEDATEELRAMFDIDDTLGRAQPGRPDAQPSAASLARSRQLNELILRLLARTDNVLPRQLWRKFHGEIAVPGDPIEPGELAEVSKSFEAQNKQLLKDHPALTPATLKRDRARPGGWSEADPGNGYRASQYLLAFKWRIDKATREERKTKLADLKALNGKTMTGDAPTAAPAPVAEDGPSAAAQAIMPPLAVQNFHKLKDSSFRPHNKLGRVNDEESAPPYDPMPPRNLPKGSTGNVIVGCMKNEAPYIVEWVAYHRAMGVDTFLIYTNDCSDGTSEILDRLQEMGVLQHRNNDNWKGNSPQQYALNQALKEPVIKNADWIIHIDVDEFINVRCGNGTLDDFFAAVPDATNVAMTWRLFGHSGVHRLSDEFVIAQFDACAPKYCPKPHTVWGFKTMFRNIGAYAKISCHRPNKLGEAFENQVKWVNGSGKDMTREVAKNGWRSSKKSIGYDLLQLNHYALRSAESFLIKRQRGRALHVDRSIGLNYWIRMDWGDARDVTIQRNIPRLRAEYDRLMQDKVLARWHAKGLEWHRAKAEELHAMPEFEDLYQQAVKINLSGMERVAYALALDMES